MVDSREALLEKIDDICSKNNVSADQLFKKLESDAKHLRADAAPQPIAGSITSDLTSLLQSMHSAQSENDRLKLNLGKHQSDFNKRVDIAAEKVNLAESPSIAFAKQPLQFKTEQVKVGDKLTHRECRDSVFQMLTYFHLALRSEKYNRLTKKEKKLYDNIQNRFEKGNFAGLNLSPSQKNPTFRIIWYAALRHPIANLPR